MSTWETMDDKSRDAWIAEHVMKWKLDGNQFDGYWWTGAPVLTRPASNGSWMGMVWEPSTSATCDYLVLQKVRETWCNGAVCDVRDGLQIIWELRADRQNANPWGCVQYEPGDYSHAAHMALTGEAE